MSKQESPGKARLPRQLWRFNTGPSASGIKGRPNSSGRSLMQTALSEGVTVTDAGQTCVEHARILKLPQIRRA